MTTPILILVYAVAAVAVFGVFAALPLWVFRRHPDTAPANELPEYLRADWQNLPTQKLTGADR